MPTKTPSLSRYISVTVLQPAGNLTGSCGQVCLFAFDILYYNGDPLIKRSFHERRELLKSTFT